MPKYDLALRRFLPYLKITSIPQSRSYHTSALLSSQARIMQIAPGLIHIKKAILEKEQKELTNIILERGNHPTDGFWKKDKDNKVLNSAFYRGRMFTAVSAYPKLLSDLCHRNLKLAVDADKTLEMKEATHAIILYYQTLIDAPAKGYIPWHQDNGENDGEKDYPIVSFSLGNSCDFLVSLTKPKISPSHPASNPENVKRLLCESGDVVVNGGPSRLMWHSIFKIHLNTNPSYLPLNNARINVTLRYTPKMIGDEARFKTPQDSTMLSRDNQFYKLSKMK